MLLAFAFVPGGRVHAHIQAVPSLQLSAVAQVCWEDHCLKLGKPYFTKQNNTIVNGDYIPPSQSRSTVSDFGYEAPGG